MTLSPNIFFVNTSYFHIVARCQNCAVQGNQHFCIVIKPGTSSIEREGGRFAASSEVHSTVGAVIQVVRDTFGVHEGEL